MLLSQIQEALGHMAMACQVAEAAALASQSESDFEGPFSLQPLILVSAAPSTKQLEQLTPAAWPTPPSVLNSVQPCLCGGGTNNVDSNVGRTKLEAAFCCS